MRLASRLAAVVTALAALAAGPASAQAANPFLAAGMNAPLDGVGDGLRTGVATRLPLEDPDDITVEADGDLLVLEATRVYRVAANGTVARVRINASPFQASSIEALPGGGFLVTDALEERILRVAGDGSVTPVAGDGEAGFTGDGGPATSARFTVPRDVAVAGDGSWLVADSFNHRIRRVAPDGTITTVAGSGEINDAGGGFGGDGGPATSARLNLPTGVAPLPGGGFLIADSRNNRVRRVAPDGTISTAASVPGVVGVEAAPGDGYVATGDSVLRFGPDGRPTTVRRCGGECPYRAAKLAPDGGLLLVGAAIEYLPPAAPQRLAVAAGPSPRPARRPLLTWSSTQAGEATIDVYAGRRRIGRVRAPAQAGANRARLRLRIRPGTLYRADITVRSQGRIAFDRVIGVTRGPLSKIAARGVSRFTERSNDDDEDSTRECVRMSSRRVDCRIESVDKPCHRIVSVTRAPAARNLSYRTYRCPIRRRPGRFGKRRTASPADLVFFDSRIR